MTPAASARLAVPLTRRKAVEELKMSRGGARNRSGPGVDEASGRSDRRGIKFSALPPEGYDGEAPEFPLPGVTDRELEVWADVWSYPQAHAWIAQPRLWRHVAMYVRWSVRMEADDASAALGNVVMRYADDAGISAAGMKFLGWKVGEPKSEDAPGGEPDAPTPAAGDASVTSIKDRLNRGSA